MLPDAHRAEKALASPGSCETKLTLTLQAQQSHGSALTLKTSRCQVLDHGYCWSATANVGGELYQAFFDTAAGAFDALVAAGHNLPDDLAAAAIAYETEQQAAAAEAAVGAEPDELDAGDSPADMTAAEQASGDGNGAAGSLRAVDAEANPITTATSSLLAGPTAPGPARHAADEGLLQVTAEPQHQPADTEASMDATAAAESDVATPARSAAELPAADSHKLAAAVPQAAPESTAECPATAAGPEVELAKEPAVAVSAAICQATPAAAGTVSAAAASEAPCQHPAELAHDLSCANQRAQLASAVYEPPASASAAPHDASARQQ